MVFTMSVFKFGYSCSNQYGRCLLLLVVSLTFTHVARAQQISTAQLTIEGISNSSATRGKNFSVTHYADEACSRRGKTHKVFEKKYADSVHTFNALAVETGQPFIFQIAYLEKRRGEVRRCTSIANVDLKENGIYKAVFSIMGEVTGCNIKIYDLNPAAIIDENEVASFSSSSDELIQTEAEQDLVLDSSMASSPVQIEHEKPANTCDKVGETGYKNGTPVYTYKSRLG